MHNMSAGKSASRPLLPVEETIHARTLMNSEFRFHAYTNGISQGIGRLAMLRGGPLRPGDNVRRFFKSPAHINNGRLHHIGAGRGNTYRPEQTKWSTPFSRGMVDYPFNVDWYMREHNTVANVKKFVGEFH